VVGLVQALGVVVLVVAVGGTFLPPAVLKLPSPLRPSLPLPPPPTLLSLLCPPFMRRRSCLSRIRPPFSPENSPYEEVHTPGRGCLGKRGSKQHSDPCLGRKERG